METASLFIPHLITMLSGTIMGFLAGLIPGVGLVILLFLSYPFILELSLFQLILYYLSACSASQFSGSVIATCSGIPGDSSSLPAVKEGNAMFADGRGHFAISNAALGSVVGSFFAVASVMILMPFALETISKFYNNNVQLGILTFASTMIIFMYGKSIFRNILLYLGGMFLASIGVIMVPYMITWKSFIPYEAYPRLYEGLPFFSVACSLFVIPVLWQSWNISKSITTNRLYKDIATFGQHIKEFFKHIGSVIRGSLIGTVAGLVPHMTTALASNLSYILEKRRQTKLKRYDRRGDIKCLTAAETANNSAAFIQLMPLILIGVPITTSEAILLSIIERTSYGIDYRQTVETGLFNELVLWFVCVNAICFTFAWPIVQYVNHIQKISLKKILIWTMIVLIFLVWYIGNRNMDGFFHLLTFFCLAPLGWLLRREDTIILIIGFVLQGKLTEAATIFYNIYIS